MTMLPSVLTVWRGTVLALCFLVLAGCSEPVDLSPVPTEASAPYACDGVPQRGPDLILGGPAPVKFPEQPGTRSEDPLWQCTFDNGDGYLVIRDELLTASGDFGRDEATALRVIESFRTAEPIEADFPGQGFIVGSTAIWLCNARVVIVELISRPDDSERDAAQDVTNLLLSQLPFVCEGVEMPEAEDPGED